MTLAISLSATYTANFRKELNITFQNSFIGVGNPGSIKVNGNVQTSAYTTQVIAQNPPQTISAEALNQVYIGVSYTFTNWAEDGTLISSSASTNFTPNDHAIYTANYTGKPTLTPNVAAGGPVGTPVMVTWSNHPRGNTIEYHLWRKVKHQQSGTWGNPVELAMLSYGTTCYTDYDYVNTNGYTDDLLQYDVRARYLTEGTDADPNYVTAFGRSDVKIAAWNDDDAAQLGQERPSDYLLLNYPNPFNPTTTIRFDLLQSNFVRLEVFDVRGSLVATLVHEQKPAGIHQVQFEALQLPAGLYFCRLQAGPIAKMQKMALVK